MIDQQHCICMNEVHLIDLDLEILILETWNEKKEEIDFFFFPSKIEKKNRNFPCPLYLSLLSDGNKVV
jgi:hypothetical protein